MSWFEQAKSLAKQAAEAAEIAAFEAQVHAREFVKTRGGVPKFITSVAGLGCAGVAVVGTANVTLEVASKFYAPKDCRRCNGWESVQCAMCFGTGVVKFHIKNSGLDRSEETPGKLAEAVQNGRAVVADIPPNADFGMPLPSRSCGRCEGSGVVKCPTCHGCANKLDKVNFDQLFGAPKMSWKLYDANRPQPDRDPFLNPEMARALLFDVPEAQLGEKFSDADKDAIWVKYQQAYQYDWAREAVINKAPGWIEAQQLMENLDPERAATDPAIVRDLPLHFAEKQLVSEIFQLPVPPRPDDWKMPDVTEDMRKKLAELKEPGLRSEAERILNNRHQMLDQMLDQQWADAWHTQKFVQKLKREVDDSTQEEVVHSPATIGTLVSEAPKPNARDGAQEAKGEAEGSSNTVEPRIVKKKKKKATSARKAG